MNFGSPVYIFLYLVAQPYIFGGKLLKLGLKAAVRQWSGASCLTGEHTALETKSLLTGVVGIHPVKQHSAQKKYLLLWEELIRSVQVRLAFLVPDFNLSIHWIFPGKL